MIRNQFFTSFEEGDPQPRSLVGARTKVGPGPAHSPTAKTGVGFTGVRALRYSASEFTRAVLFEVNLPITERTELSYVVFPAAGKPSKNSALPELASLYRGTYVAVDVIFEDGSTFAGLGGTDQRGVPLTALAQGAAKTLSLDQWNYIRGDLGALAAGRTARAIVLTIDSPTGFTDGAVAGWLDDIRIGIRTPRQDVDEIEYVRTTRGTHSSADFSRGNTFPATAVPNGFNFWTPVTNASASNWIYEYHRGNNVHNESALEAFALSHQPSPWMGDRHTFQVMPGIGELTTDRRHRALAFSHHHEIDQPHHYGVRFNNGIKVDIAPTEHAALFRFTFPTTPGWLVFDNVNNRGGLRVDPVTGTVTGHTWVRSRLSVGARRMFIYVTFDRPAVSGQKMRRPPWRKVLGYLAFDSFEVTMRIATSLISLEQAKRNLAQEIPLGSTFAGIQNRARTQWQDILGQVEIEGASEDQLSTFYSNLYRLFLYPNSAEENTGTAEKPRDRHASPVVRRWWPSTRKRTGAKVIDGPMSVNNGFWDTYRTVWPAYALLAPQRCGKLFEGFVQQYREGGWISRWSAPGYANLMTGTSSDVAIADAYLKGVRNFDVQSAYDAALRNATVTPPNKSVGRQGLTESIFLGYTPTSTSEGLSWTLEGCINDFGIAQFSQALLEQSGDDDPRRQEYADNARYFSHRARNYVHHFDRRMGFFQGKDNQGNWRCSPTEYDPKAWGGDYTETNGWNMAFSVPHDGAGLANLRGGRTALESTLDRFFQTAETGTSQGAYGKIIHEMIEARDIRLGQYGHSNQPSHHIPYLYNHAGAPSKTQAIVREILRRCYLGGEIGQGYPGDEDNGEMSAWYIFSALGFYPLSAGSPHYTIGSPLFTKATIHLENGHDLVIHAPGNSEKAVYVRGVTLNGVPYPSTSISHETLSQGGVLTFDMAETPAAWGREYPPPSLTEAHDMPRPLEDLIGNCTSSDGTDVALLRDNTAATQVTFSSATPTLEFTVTGKSYPVEIYTLTSSSKRGDPRSWVFEGSRDGLNWVVLDERKDQVFPWRQQTRPFALAQPSSHAHYRLRITNSTARRISLTQWEILGQPPQQR